MAAYSSLDGELDSAANRFGPQSAVSPWLKPPLVEDPVTGSAHCCLADFWGKRLNKTKMVGYQASTRGGIVHVEVRGQRVIPGGEGVIFAEGELAIK